MILDYGFWIDGETEEIGLSKMHLGRTGARRSSHVGGDGRLGELDVVAETRFHES